MKKVKDHYFSHGESITKTIKKFGYPKPSTLKYWIYKDKRFKGKKKYRYNKNNKYTNDDKIDAVKNLFQEINQLN